MKIILLLLCCTVIIFAQKDTMIVSSREDITRYLSENTAEQKAVKDTILATHKKFSSEDDSTGAGIFAALFYYVINYQRHHENYVPDYERELGKFTYNFNNEDGQPEKLETAESEAAVRNNNELPVEDGAETIAILYFEQGMAEIHEGGYELLENMLDTMKTHPDYKWQIAGHVDISEDASRNKALAIERALTVKKYFMNKGIDRHKLKIEFTGKDKFAEAAFNEEGEGVKRRVIISRLK